MNCPECEEPVKALARTCPECGEPLPILKRRAKRLPRAYARIQDQSRWTYGVPIGTVLLLAGLAVAFRVFEGFYDMDRARDARIEKTTTPIPPGEGYFEEVLYREQESYAFVVNPYEHECRVAFVRIGGVTSRPDRQNTVRLLRAKGERVLPGQSLKRESIAEPGRYAWGIWHDQAAPVRAFILFLDSRSR